MYLKRYWEDWEGTLSCSHGLIFEVVLKLLIRKSFVSCKIEIGSRRGVEGIAKTVSEEVVVVVLTLHHGKRGHARRF